MKMRWQIWSTRLNAWLKTLADILNSRSVLPHVAAHVLFFLGAPEPSELPWNTAVTVSVAPSVPSDLISALPEVCGPECH